LDIRLLKTFHTIVKLGSFQGAAEELMYSQSTVTIHIQKLEEQLGVKLIERNKKNGLTEAGQFLLNITEDLLKEYRDVNLIFNDFLQGEAGYIKLGVSEPSTSKRLPSLLATFSNIKPNVQFEIQAGTTMMLTKPLLNSEIDIALCYSPINLNELEFTPLFEEKMMLLLYEDHPLAEQEIIKLEDLQNETLLFTIGECPFKYWIEQKIKLKELNTLLKNQIGIGSLTSIKYFVQKKIGISILPKIECMPLIPGTIMRPIENISDGPIFGILVKSDNSTISSMTRQFKQYLIEDYTKEFSI